MRVLRSVVVLMLVTGAACQRGPGMCPEGMRPDRGPPADGKSVWCKGTDPTVSVWIELRSPTDRFESCTFRDGKPDGPFQAWHPGGKKWVEGQFRAGAMIGHWTQWDKSGNRVAEGDYRIGRLVGGAPVGMVSHCEAQKP